MPAKAPGGIWWRTAYPCAWREYTKPACPCAFLPDRWQEHQLAQRHRDHGGNSRAILFSNTSLLADLGALSTSSALPKTIPPQTTTCRKQKLASISFCPRQAAETPCLKYLVLCAFAAWRDSSSSPWNRAPRAGIPGVSVLCFSHPRHKRSKPWGKSTWSS
jgi:hypothetical protein